MQSIARVIVAAAVGFAVLMALAALSPICAREQAERAVAEQKAQEPLRKKLCTKEMDKSFAPLIYRIEGLSVYVRDEWKLLPYDAKRNIRRYFDICFGAPLVRDYRTREQLD